MTTDTIHTCSYSCERPGCIRAQRDELVAKVEALRAEVEAWRELSDHVRVGACKAIWPDRYVDERIRDVAAALVHAGQRRDPLQFHHHHAHQRRHRLALGAQAGEARLAEVFRKAGFTHFRRAAETPFNLTLEARL